MRKDIPSDSAEFWEWNDLYRSPPKGRQLRPTASRKKMFSLVPISRMKKQRTPPALRRTSRMLEDKTADPQRFLSAENQRALRCVRSRRGLWPGDATGTTVACATAKEQRPNKNALAKDQGARKAPTSKTDSTRIGCRPRGGTVPPELSRRFPARAGSGPPRLA